MAKLATLVKFIEEFQVRMLQLIFVQTAFRKFIDMKSIKNSNPLLSIINIFFIKSYFLVFLLIPTFLNAQPTLENDMGSYAGNSFITIVDKENNVSFPVLVMYPRKDPSKKINLGPFSINSSEGAAVAEGRFPIVIISHGSGGNYLGYLTIAQYLTEHGYIVAMPEHYGNNRNNNDLDGTINNLVYRPRHISLVIDAITYDSKFKAHVENNKVAIIGHSMGGYTALAVAGGEPWSEKGKRVDVTADSRVKSLVLLAPATHWYIPENSLKEVETPIFMLTAEHDQPLPKGWHKETSDIVLHRLAETTEVKFRIVDNSGHFSFLSPFPKSMTTPSFPPSIDPDGFDREKFHNRLNLEIYEFLKSTL